MLECQLDSSFYHKKLGDPYNSSKGNISIVINDSKMLINSMDNVISLYDMYNICSTVPIRLTGHKSQKEFYGKFC
jgi:hypothetical protein